MGDQVLKYDIEIAVAYPDKSWDVKKFVKIPAKTVHDASQHAIRRAYHLYSGIHCWHYSEKLSE